MNSLMSIVLLVPALAAVEETDALGYKVAVQSEIMQQIFVTITTLEMYQLDPPTHAMLKQLAEELEKRKARIRHLAQRRVHGLQRNPELFRTKFSNSRLILKQNLAQLIKKRLKEADSEGGNQRLADVLEAEREKLTLEIESLRFEFAIKKVAKPAAVESGVDVDQEKSDGIPSPEELEELLNVTVKRHLLLMDLKDRKLKPRLHITPLGRPDGGQ